MYKPNPSEMDIKVHIHCWRWLRKQQTGGFCKLLQWCHSSCCIPFRGMVNKVCYCFHCPRWYCQDVANEDNLAFWTRFWGSFEFHCQMWEMYEAMCLERFSLLVLLKCKPTIVRASFFITTKFSANVLSPMSKLGVLVANGFSIWPFLLVFEGWEGLRFWRWCSGAFCFIVQFILSIGTEIGSWIYQVVHC